MYFKDIEPRLRQYITQGIRKAFRYSTLYKTILYRNRIECKVNNRKRVFYPCEQCGEQKPQKDCQIDHINTVIPFNKTLNDLTINEYLRNVFCAEDNLQRLCKTCHTKKTTLEKTKRKEAKIK